MKLDASFVDEKGTTKRKQLIFLQETKGILDPLLANEPRLWDQGAHLLDWFWELGAARQVIAVGMGGAMQLPLSYESIHAWACIRKIDLSTWELHAIKALDTAYLAHVNLQKKTG